MHVLYVTNIPTPYRNSLFNAMARIFPEFGMSFEVLFMAWTEAGRMWRFVSSDFEYQYRVPRGVTLNTAPMAVHLNPAVVGYAAQGRYDVAVVGGMGSPTHWATAGVLPKSALRVLWTEGGLNDARVMKGIGLRVKRSIVRRFDAYQVTGQRAADYITALDPDSAHKPHLLLRNVINEPVFVGASGRRTLDAARIRARFGLRQDGQLWICPARLIPIKGLVEFLPCTEGVEGIEVVIAGDGPLKDTIAQLVERMKLPVTLVGYQDEPAMADLYAAADVFLLPSLRDPSPLAAIEALASGLPLLVSNRIGNHDDVLSPGENGWTHDPDAPLEVRRCQVAAVARATRGQLQAMSTRSEELYQQRFSLEKTVRCYAEQLVEVCKRHQAGKA